MTKKELKALEIVLDFVERWNKQDKEVEVAHAHHLLETLLIPKNKSLSELFEGMNDIYSNFSKSANNIITKQELQANEK